MSSDERPGIGWQVARGIAYVLAGLTVALATFVIGLVKMAMDS